VRGLCLAKLLVTVQLLLLQINLSDRYFSLIRCYSEIRHSIHNFEMRVVESYSGGLIELMFSNERVSCFFRVKVFVKIGKMSHRMAISYKQ